MSTYNRTHSTDNQTQASIQRPRNPQDAAVESRLEDIQLQSPQPTQPLPKEEVTDEQLKALFKKADTGAQWTKAMLAFARSVIALGK